MKKVLMIAYFFPPLGGAGIQRTLKFVQYLPGFGWLPLVLTQKGGHHYAYDHEQLKLVPTEVEVVRACSLEATGFRFAVRKLLKIVIALGGGNRQDRGVPDGGELSASKAVFPLSLVRKFIENWLFIPDSKIRWFPAAVHSGLRLVKNRRIEALYSTSYPYTCHLIGYLLKKISGKPWVADFRDPWAENAFMTRNFSPLRKRIDRWLEHKVVQEADAVVLTAKPIAEEFIGNYPSEDSSKFRVIPNGYDEKDFQQAEVKNPAKFTIVFTGALTPSSSPGQFFEALSQIAGERPDVISDIRVVLVGWIEQSFRRHVRELGVDHVVEVMNYVPRKRCIRIMVGASVLLLPLSKSWKDKGIFTGKLFDYLCARKPILALVPEDVAAQLIRQTESGIVVDPENKEAIADAILTLYAEHKRNVPFPGKRPLLPEYSRKHLTERLAQVLDGLSPSRDQQ